jgi:chemotaxis protein CheX
MAMKLDVNFVNPFIAATLETLESMTNLKGERTGLHIKEKREHCFGDISGILGFAGQMTGNFAISMPTEVSITIVENMIGEKPEWGSPLLRDGIREIANVIVGTAKGKITEQLGISYNLSLPTVITGKNHYIAHPSEMIVIIVEFSISEVGLFAVEICYRKDE